MIKIRKLAPVLLTLFSFTVSAAEQDDYTHKIVGGEEVSAGAWPSVVALVRDANTNLFQRQFCAGNVIAEQWILTAAHCLFDTSGNVVAPDEFLVAAGVTDLEDESSATEIEVEAFAVHPFYDPENQSGHHDIALLKLKIPTVEPAMDFFVGDLAGYSGSSAIVIGWGASAYPKNPSEAPRFPTILNQVTLPLVSREVCNLPASYDGLIAEGQFCAGYAIGGADSCVGDSGGPIMMQQGAGFRQIGVVSFGDGCALPDKYGVYTDLPFYASWAQQYLDGAVEPKGYEPQFEPNGSATKRTGGGASLYLLGVLSLLTGLRLRWQRQRHLGLSHLIVLVDCDQKFVFIGPNLPSWRLERLFLS